MLLQVQKEIGDFPVIIRPAFTLGGTGGGIAYNMDEFKEIMGQGLAASVTNQVLLSVCPCVCVCVCVRAGEHVQNRDESREIMVQDLAASVTKQLLPYACAHL